MKPYVFPDTNQHDTVSTELILIPKIPITISPFKD